VKDKAGIVFDRVLRVMRPVVRLLVRHGVPYTALATALKRVFVEAAKAELAHRRMAQSDSAVSLLSGVHRRDVRNFGRGGARRGVADEAPRSLVGEVIARWMSTPEFLGPDGSPRVLSRSGDQAAGSFDALAVAISRDVRPRAILDEMIRLGVAEEDDRGVRLLASGFAPRRDFEELARLFADNLQDHAAAAVANLEGERNFLEQSVFVDEISEASAEKLQKVSVQAWKQAFRMVMNEAQARFDDDAANEKAENRRHRARFGVYFYSEPEE
jgi:hypothetical protein